MPRYLPIRSPFYAQFERWPYTRGPNYTRAMFREQGPGGYFTAQPMNRMPPLLGLGYVGTGETPENCTKICTDGCGSLDKDCFNGCYSQCMGISVPVTPDNKREGETIDCNAACAGKTGEALSRCVFDCGTGRAVPKSAQAGFFADFWSSPVKMVGTLAVVGGLLWWVTSRKRATANPTKLRAGDTVYFLSGEREGKLARVSKRWKDKNGHVWVILREREPGAWQWRARERDVLRYAVSVATF
ncbi:MAG: hypothetical protein WC683_02425 [bacterium]